MKNILNNQTIFVHVIEDLGFVDLTEMKTQFKNSGIVSKFFLLLQEYLGFRYEVTTSKSTDLIFFLIEDKIHLYLPVLMLVELWDFMDFSPAISIEGIKFLIKKPAELSKINAIVRPFAINMWIAIAVSFIISTIIFSIIFWKDAKLYKRKHVKINQIAWALFGSFTAQGNDLFCPSGECCRLLVSGWILATFIITSSYSGALMSFITFPGREFVPRTFSELTKLALLGYYTVGIPPISGVMEQFANFPGDVGGNFKKLKELNKFENVSVDENLANKIIKEKYAPIVADITINIFISRYGTENFLVSKDQLLSVSAGFGIIKNFRYKKYINKTILRLYETGTLEKFTNDEKLEAIKKRQTIVQENTDGVRALNVTDLAGPLLLLIIGYALSIAVFFLEIIVNKLD